MVSITSVSVLRGNFHVHDVPSRCSLDFGGHSRWHGFVFSCSARWRLHRSHSLDILSCSSSGFLWLSMGDMSGLLLLCSIRCTWESRCFCLDVVPSFVLVLDLGLGHARLQRDDDIVVLLIQPYFRIQVMVETNAEIFVEIGF